MFIKRLQQTRSDRACAVTTAGTIRRARRVQLMFPVLAAALLAVSPGYARDPLPAQLAQQPDETNSTAVTQTITQAPSLPLRFAAAALRHASPGDRFSFELPRADAEPLTVTAVIDGDGQFINGDRVIFARGVPEQPALESLRVVLTAGRDAVFAEITLSGQRWMLDASREADEVVGVLYSADASASVAPPVGAHAGHQAHAPQHFVIPDAVAPDGAVRPLAPDRPQTSELLLGSTSAVPTSTVPTSTVPTATVAAASALDISQTFSEYALYVGESQDLEVTLQFRNTSGQSLNRLVADVYFILEDSELLAAPACSRVLTNTSPRQPILRCELSGSLAPGATRSLTYQVRVPAKSSPMRLWSTVFVGAQRHDANLNVVNNLFSAMMVSDADSKFQPGYPELISDRLGNVVIDVMTLYSADAEALYGPATATRINQLISVANQIYQDSGVAITLRPVYQAPVPYLAGGGDMYRQLDELTSGNHPAFSDVKTLRERYGADLVVMFRPMDLQSDLCGLANLGGYRTMGDMTAFNEKDHAYSLVAIDCPISSALVHELGHNMGLTHSHLEDGSGGTFPFATGYGVNQQFATVMATPRRFGNAARISRFSDPGALCLGMPCGVDHLDSVHGADAVRALNMVRYQIASYMPMRVPLLPSRQVGRLNGQSTSARIGIGATTDKGLSYAQRIYPAQRMDITADFYVDKNHVGQQGQFHVLADLSAAGLGLVQLNERGEIFGWDGSVKALVPFSAPAALKPVEYLRILNDFQPISELHGFPLVLFLAYQLGSSGDVIYTQEPLVVEIAPSR